MNAIETIQATRSVRLFVSSTFSDMRQERRELAEKVFPRVRQWCEERGIAFTDIDLRWGITNEQGEAGQALRICLEEVGACRPFFLGLLGDRYGSIASRISDDDLRAHPWLARYPDCSYTELEFLHALWEGRAAPPIALIYERRDVVADTGAPDHPPQAKLNELKARVRAEGLCARLSGYSDPAELGRWVFDDLRQQLELIFPLASPSSTEVAEGQVQARIRRLRGRSLVGFRDLLNALDRNASASTSVPIAVAGEAGSGKSSLLAAWFALLSREFAPTVVVPINPFLKLFLGDTSHAIKASTAEGIVAAAFCTLAATPQTTSWHGVATFLTRALREQLHLPIESGSHSSSAPAALNDALLAAAAHGRTVIVIDGLDFLGEAEAARALASLPAPLPPTLRLFFSVRPGAVARQLIASGATRIEMRKWNKAEMGLFLEEFRKDHAKSFSRTDRARLLAAPQSAHPLFLNTSLGELRLASTREELHERLGEHLASPHLNGLFYRVLARCEDSYDRERPHLVRDCLSLLMCARRGLGESELRDLLGTRGAPLPAPVWSPLAVALRPHLAQVEGLLIANSAAFRDAARSLYLPTRDARVPIHDRLANYFAAHSSVERAMQELPWQLLWATRIDDLATTLSSPKFLTSAWRLQREELLGLAAELKAADFQVAQMLKLKAVALCAELASAEAAAQFLRALGETAEALPYASAALAKAEQSGNEEKAAELAGLLADLELRRGNLMAAEKCFHALADQARAHGHTIQMGLYLGNRGTILRELNRPEEAWACFLEEEFLSRESQNPIARAVAQGHLGQIEFDRGQFAEALARFQDAIRLCRQQGDFAQLQSALGNAAACHAATGCLEEAMRLHQEEEELCRRRADRFALQVCLGNQARVLQRFRTSDYDRAIKLLEERERLARELGDPAAEAATLLQFSKLYHALSSVKLHEAAIDYAARAAQLAARHDLEKLSNEVRAWREQLN